MQCSLSNSPSEDPAGMHARIDPIRGALAE